MPEASETASTGVISRLLEAFGVKWPKRLFDRNNAIFAFLVGAAPAVGGSVVSVLLGAAFVWGILSLAARRFPWRMTHSDRILATVFTIYAGAVFLTGAIADNPGAVFQSTLWLLPFLSLWVVIPRLRASQGIDYLQYLILGAVVGAIGAMAFALVEVGLNRTRPEGGAGNAVIFAAVTLCLAGMAGLAIDARRRALRVLAVFAVFAGFIAVTLSLTRGAVIVIPLVLLLLVMYAPQRWRSIVANPTGLAVIAFSIAMLFAYRDRFLLRFAQTAAELELVISDGQSESVGERLRLWRAAWSAFLDAPVFGHGIQNRMDSLVPYLSLDGLAIRGFSHAHNGFLSAALDGGLVVLVATLAILIAPAVVAWRAPPDPAHRRRLFLAVILAAVYAAIGMTQIMFKHDIMDSFYLFSVILVAASIPDRTDSAARAASSAAAGGGNTALARQPPSRSGKT